jgi:hypothetical protein
VLHRLNGVTVTAATLDVAEEVDVLAIRMPVVPPTEVVTEKLLSLNEHHCDFATFLPAARAVREQVDWATVRKATAGHPFAESFLFLTDRLGVTG